MIFGMAGEASVADCFLNMDGHLLTTEDRIEQRGEGRP